MSDQKKPDEMTIIREEVHSLIKIVRDLEQAFPGRHFTLDGHLLGSIGEVLAVYYYGIELYTASAEKHDGCVDGKEVQIKITQRDTVLLSDEPDYLIVLYLNSNGTVFEVYNGPGKEAWESGGKPDKRNYKHLRVNKLMELDSEVKDEDRIPQIKGIRKMQKEFKNKK